ncbi:MAG: N-formylglutamate amidohydrolase [bacterium]|nr:N-formylglutamate amidohydrolase [bacterium]
MAKNVFSIDLPLISASCVVADSPHSGKDYPVDFDYACDLHSLRQAEDMAVDNLYNFLPATGVPLLQAQFPRSYIDANRAEFFDGRLSGEYHAGDSSLVRGVISPRHTEKIYDRKLNLSEVFNRVADYHRPYHDKLAAMIDDVHARHGKAVHLNLHSMPSTINRGTGVNPFDIAIGTRDGDTCAPHIAEKLQALFAAKGYNAVIDTQGYRGAEIVRRHGDPFNDRHSLQVEVNRALYMDEKTLQLKPEFAQLQNDLREIMGDFIGWCDSPAVASKPQPSTGAAPHRPAA